MRKYILPGLHLIGVPILLITLIYFGVIDLPALLKAAQKEGAITVASLIIFAYAVKGWLSLVPSFGWITANCALLPLWIGIPVAIAGHMLGQTICWFWGPASRRKHGKDLPRWFNPRKTWHLVSAYFFIPQTDCALVVLRTASRHVSDWKVLACGLPFIILADVIIVVGGKTIVHFFKLLL